MTSLEKTVNNIAEKFGVGEEELVNKIVVVCVHDLFFHSTKLINPKKDGNKIYFTVDMIDDDFRVSMKYEKANKKVKVRYKKNKETLDLRKLGVSFEEWFAGLLKKFQKKRNEIIDMYNEVETPMGDVDYEYEVEEDPESPNEDNITLEYTQEMDQDIIGGSEDDMTNLMLLREQPYKSLTSEEIKKMESEAVGRICEVLSITEAGARIVLRKYRWEIEKIMNKFSTYDRKKILMEVGLASEDVAKKRVAEKITCLICFEDYSEKKTTGLRSCGHRFCNGCWKEYLTEKIHDGMSKQINCMYPKCKSCVDDDIVRKFVVDPKVKKKYDQKVLDSFIEDNSRLKWCQSTPFCGRAAEVRINPETPQEIHCDCGHVWCFACVMEPHCPASCVMLKFWKKKCSDDSETLKWIHSHTRDCPQCKNATEKNGGCNHITCQSCGAHWCWACGGLFNASTVYGHGCNKYLEKGSSGNSTNDRASLERYLHYYNHYNSHLTSVKNQEKTRTSVDVKVRQMYKQRPNSAWVEIEWLKNGMEVLFETRRALMMSYVFAFYLFDKVANKKALDGCRLFQSTRERERVKDLFESTQQYLEKTTEQLSKELDKPLKQMLSGSSVKNEIMKNSVLNEKSVHALFDIIRKEMVVDGEYLLPEPSFIVTQPSYESNTLNRDRKKNFRSHNNPPPKPKPKKVESRREEDDLQRAIRASLLDQQYGGGTGGGGNDDLELQRVLLLSLQDK